jgi:hypothetical protein
VLKPSKLDKKSFFTPTNQKSVIFSDESSLRFLRVQNGFSCDRNDKAARQFVGYRWNFVNYWDFNGKLKVVEKVLRRICDYITV